MHSSKSIAPIHLYIMIFILVFNISLAFKLNLPISIGIMASILYIFTIAWSKGYKPYALLKLIVNSFNTVKTVLFMLIMISLTLPLWMASGTLPTLVHYSFIYLSNFNVPLSAFFISALLSLMLGTYIGTLSIVGPLFISLAYGLSIPTPIIAGALVSGALVGDRLSPVSSNFHLICASCKADIKDTFVSLLKTNLPAFIITAGIYAFLGHSYILDTHGKENIITNLQLLESNFPIDPLLCLPVLFLLLMIVSKKMTVAWSFFTTFIISLGFYFYLRGSIDQLGTLLIKGFHPKNTDLHQLISGSGLSSMIAVPIIILLSAYLNDLLKEVELITVALEGYTKSIKSQTGLFHKTACLSVLVTTISCNQSLTAIITGGNLQVFFQRFKLSNSLLARTIADTGAIVIAVIPWNLNALVAVSITGVSTMAYAPYAFYVYIPLIFTLLYPLFNEKRLLYDTESL